MYYIKKIRDLREDNDLTQSDVAKYLEIAQTVYSRYETGKNELPIHHLIKLCYLYKISSDKILGIKLN